MKISKTEKILKKMTRYKGDAHVEFEWSQIDDSIYVGTNVCCQLHFDRYLLKLGVTANVSMEGERIDHPEGIDVYLWLPTKDHEAPSIDKLMIGVKSIDEMIANGHKVYIHCKNGHGRGPTMAAAYYIYKGKSAEEAIKFIELKRDEAHIEDMQIEVLKDFYKKINN